MDSKENQLNLLSELIQRRKLGDITRYGEYDKDEDLFTQEIISEFREAWGDYQQTLTTLIDKVISHLAE